MSSGKRSCDAHGPRRVLRGVVTAFLCTVLAFGTGCASEAAASASNQAADAAGSTAAAERVEKQADGVLSFVLEPGANVPNLRFQVLVDGETNEGETVHEYYSAEVGTKYALEYGAGAYALSVVAGTLTHEGVVYKATDASVAFDALSDKSVELRVSKDEEATSALAAEKAAAEAAAQKEAEEKAAAEKAAAEKAAAEAAQKEAEEKAAAEAAQKEAEEKAAAEAAARKEAEEKAAAEAAERQQTESVSAEAQERTVYITKTGTKYHNASCRHLKKSKIEISLSDAVARGYEPCKTCGG